MNGEQSTLEALYRANETISTTSSDKQFHAEARRTRREVFARLRMMTFLRLRSVEATATITP
jgi:hypothetical protein